MTKDMVDVVTVPDFRGGRASVFEGQSLLFLASWMRHAGAARRFPLHLACLGAPPESVVRLAEQAGARIHELEPIRLRAGHHVGNKLRGLEVRPNTGRILLVDTDVVFLQDISSVAKRSDLLAAAPDDYPKITLRQWSEIYREMGETLPAERSGCTLSELALPGFPRKWAQYKVPRQELSSSLPYFNSGVVLTADPQQLREDWERALHDVWAAVDETRGPQKWIHHSDQAGFAVAVHRYLREGKDVGRLPSALHTRWRHLYGIESEPLEVGILHLTTFLHGMDCGQLTGSRLLTGVRDYLGAKMLRRVTRMLISDLLEGHPRRGLSRFPLARRRCATLIDQLTQLCQHEIQPALDGSVETGDVSARGH